MEQVCIPVGCVLSSALATGGGGRVPACTGQESVYPVPQHPLGRRGEGCVSQHALGRGCVSQHALSRGRVPQHALSRGCLPGGVCPVHARIHTLPCEQND